MQSASPPAASGAHQRGAALWRGTLSAFCASLIGIGLARFAYTPLLPAIIAAHWFAAAAAAYLGAANLAGYLAGALSGRAIAGRLGTPATLRVMMLAATAAFFACGFPLSFLWFFLWRFAAGLAGGALMVLAAPSVLAHVPPARRGVVGGVIFMGVGAGVVASGTLVPLLLRHGLRATWFGLGGLSLLLAVLAWGGWPQEGPAPTSHAAAPPLRLLRALYVEYGLNAAGWVPHMIFLVDFVARGLHQGVAAGAGYWVLFGIGATCGPVLAGHIADRIGFGTTLRLAFVIEAVAVALPALGLGTLWLLVSSVVVGAFVTGTVPLVLGRIGELLPHHPARQKAAWSRATIAFALFQAGAAYGLSYVFARTGGAYRLLFGLGAGAMVLALAIDLIAAAGRRTNEF
ncbi:MAG: YbfB/YjiJ family MFS transporter [Rhodospirillales bacterium]|nr:YbfB/YjiJ family MFS transporter [Rhodospirillales bacterium]